MGFLPYPLPRSPAAPESVSPHPHPVAMRISNPLAMPSSKSPNLPTPSSRKTYHELTSYRRLGILHSQLPKRNTLHHRGKEPHHKFFRIISHGRDSHSSQIPSHSPLPLQPSYSTRN